MKTWTSITCVKHNTHNNLYHLRKIGATRWWSKDKALSSVIDLQLILNDDKIENSKPVTLLQFLTAVGRGNFNS